MFPSVGTSRDIFLFIMLPDLSLRPLKLTNINNLRLTICILVCITLSNLEIRFEISLSENVFQTLHFCQKSMEKVFSSLRNLKTFFFIED
jgi:hypothetical protein